MLQVARKVRVLDGYRPEHCRLANCLSAASPLLLKGLVRDWALVQAGSRSAQDAMAYLRSFYNGRPVQLFVRRSADRRAPVLQR